MRKEILNGTLIPYDLPIEELKIMMSSSVMKDFSLACEALSYKSEPEAYQIMKSYIGTEDQYRRLYILKTIFRHSEAAELSDFLENAIASKDVLFVENGLTVVSEYHKLPSCHQRLQEGRIRQSYHCKEGSLTPLKRL